MPEPHMLGMSDADAIAFSQARLLWLLGDMVRGRDEGIANMAWACSQEIVDRQAMLGRPFPDLFKSALERMYGK